MQTTTQLPSLVTSPLLLSVNEKYKIKTILYLCMAAAFLLGLVVSLKMQKTYGVKDMRELSIDDSIQKVL